MTDSNEASITVDAQNARDSASAGDSSSGNVAVINRTSSVGVANGNAAGLSGESAAIFSMIERAARDQTVDIDKMERLMAMQERAQANRARMAYDAAFAKMQPELPEIDKKGKIVIKEKGGERIIQSTPYALWDDTNKLIKPILAKHGFGLSFRISQTDTKITTTAILSHIDGHREDTSFSAGIDNTGSKNNVQGWGSSFSYGKRYTGTAILNITTKGEDDDGKAAGASVEVVTEEQADTLREWIDVTASDKDAFLLHFGAKTIEEFPADKFDTAVKAFQKKAKRP